MGMKFLWEKQTRRFFVGIILLIILLGIGGVLRDVYQNLRLRELVSVHDAAVVSALLKEGVAQEVAARAVTSREASAEGTQLLHKLGDLDSGGMGFLPEFYSFGVSSGLLTVCGIFLFGLFVLLAVSVFLTRREQLYQYAMDTVGKFTGGDFSQLLPQWDNGGIYQLFEKVNTMAMALKAKQEAESSAKMFLKNTISDISHQIKTPLAALSMYHEIICGEPENVKTVITFTQKAQTACGRMEHLIKTLLKLTRLDAGGIVFHKTWHSMDKLITQSLESLSERAQKEGKEIKVLGNKEDAAFCDIEWTREALGNIIKNALDHTECGGMICIDWERTPVMLRITISDNGNGVSHN